MPEHRSKGRRIADGQFAAVIRDFMGDSNPRWATYAQSTQELWGRELRLLQASPLGALSVHEIRPSLIQRYLDGLASRPAKQTACLRALSRLEGWAVVRDRLPGPIIMGCELLGSRGGYLPWTDAQIAHAEQHARPEVARIITLAAGTGQRGSDLCRMRWTDLETYRGRIGINVTQKKTKRILWVPFSEEFQRAIADWERRPGHILIGAKGRPWGRKWLSNAWQRERDTKPELDEHKRLELVLHGLRGSFVLRMRRANVDKQLIGAAAGMSAAMVDRYCRLAEQRDDAIAAIEAAERSAAIIDLSAERTRKGL